MAAESPSQTILESDKVAFDELTAKDHKEQAKWWLNAFWQAIYENNPEERETLFQQCALFTEIGKEKDQGEKGSSSLDEFGAHRFLERIGQTLTIIALREKLRKIDLNFDKRMCMSEYLLFVHDKEVSALVRPQADPVEVQKASEMVAAAQAATAEMNEKLEAQKAALAEVQAAEDEQRAALAELKAAEDALAAKKAELEKKSEEGGVVSRGRAKAELEQLKAEDPMPIRRAKITQEAAVRRLEKARKASEAAAAEAEEAAAIAEKQLADAEAYLADVSSRVGSTEGVSSFRRACSRVLSPPPSADPLAPAAAAAADRLVPQPRARGGAQVHARQEEVGVAFVCSDCCCKAGLLAAARPGARAPVRRSARTSHLHLPDIGAKNSCLGRRRRRRGARRGRRWGAC